MSVLLKNGAVCIDGQPTFIFSGEIFYHRISPDQWQDRLEKVAACGLNTIGFYTPWNYHAPNRETIDFTSPHLDVDRLLQIANSLGLKVIIRPGPFICNEWDLGGYPGWLLTEDSGDWRSGDQRHLAWCRQWYSQIDRVLAPHQQPSGGPIIVYQVENEFFWMDRDLMEGLADQVRADGISVPLISNGGGTTNMMGSSVVDGADIYMPVYDYYRWRGWMDQMRRLSEPDHPLMLLEYHAGYLAQWGEPAPTEDSLPAPWLASEDRLFIGFGANLLNHFPIAGGVTPFNFNSDNISTNYFENAPVTPWGGLTDGFYEVRRLGAFLASFNSALAISKPLPVYWGTDNASVECLARRGDRGDFFFIMNQAFTTETFVIQLPDGTRYPEQGRLRIPPHSSRQFVARLDLEEGLVLEFSTAQVLHWWRETDRACLVVYGETGDEGYAVFSRGGETRRISITVPEEATRTTIDAFGQLIEVYVITTALAERTWLIEDVSGRVPLFSNLGLVRSGRDEAGTIRAEIPVGEPIHLIAPHLKRATINGITIDARPTDDGLGVLEYTLPSEAAPTASLASPVGRAESLSWTTDPAIARDGWKQVAFFAPGPDILVNTGDYSYRTDFTVTGDLPTTLELLGVSEAETVVYLNGQALGVFPSERRGAFSANPSSAVAFPVEGIVKQGVNQLAVSFTLRGRFGGGIRVYAGFSHPVALYRQRPEHVLTDWLESPIDTHQWSRDELMDAPAPAQPGFAMEGWKSVDVSKPRTLPHGDSMSLHMVHWYHKRVSVPSSLRGGHLFLECPRWISMWAYVDGEFVGETAMDMNATFDLSKYADREEIKITLGLRHNMYEHSNWGLTAAPRLVSIERLLTDDPWYRRDRSEGERSQWMTASDGWQKLADVTPSRVLWYRQSVYISQNAALSTPWYVELDDAWRTHAEIYWNGTPIGAYATAGPDRRFYIPDGLIQPENTLMIKVDGYNGDATCGGVTMGNYETMHRVSLAIQTDRTDL